MDITRGDASLINRKPPKEKQARRHRRDEVRQEEIKVFFSYQWHPAGIVITLNVANSG